MMFYVFIVMLVPIISGQAEVRTLVNDIITSSSPDQEKIKVLSNYGDGVLTWGKEEAVTNYMELSEDPKGDWITQVMSCQMTIICCSGDLPEVFTLCSSVLAEHVTVDRHFFQLYKVKIINLGTFLLNYYLFACLFVE